jgi:glycosyltransferase involved in cell wall biosynthesis
MDNFRTQLSVIICSHNPRGDYLRRTVEALKTQTLPLEQWELVLVDNASDERLKNTCDITWHPSARHVREETIGLTAARLRGIKESRGELLVFVDDDNVLASDFLEQAAAITSRYPYLGVFGAGVIRPEFAAPPPPEVISLLGLLALRTVPDSRWSNHYEDWLTIPWGAGLCVTREVATQYGELLKRLADIAIIGRNGEYLYCGDDDLFSWVSVRLGKGFGIFPGLTVTHLIPDERVTRQYFLRLLRDKSTSSAIMKYQLSGVEPERPNRLVMIRTLVHGLKNGWFSMRCRFAEASGKREAAKMIERSRLLSKTGLTPTRDSTADGGSSRKRLAVSPLARL